MSSSSSGPKYPFHLCSSLWEVPRKSSVVLPQHWALQKTSPNLNDSLSIVSAQRHQVFSKYCRNPGWFRAAQNGKFSWKCWDSLLVGHFGCFFRSTCCLQSFTWGQVVFIWAAILWRKMILYKVCVSKNSFTLIRIAVVVIYQGSKLLYGGAIFRACRLMKHKIQC